MSRFVVYFYGAVKDAQVLCKKAMLYATDGVDSQEDFEKGMVGVASVWCVSKYLTTCLSSYLIRYEGNPYDFPVTSDIAY